MMNNILQMLTDRLDDFNANAFLNEIVEASKALGRLEAKITGYHFSGILIPMFRTKEAISSMEIEGTQTTLTDVFEENIAGTKNSSDKIQHEYLNHTRAITIGSEYLHSNGFTDELIKNIHRIMLDGIVSPKKQLSIGKYKTNENYIVNSLGKVVFTPPSCAETPKYMRELLSFMNNQSDGINPLVKAAIIHSQFESIHPFEDGNGRVGRLLISLYLYKSKVINFPFFYISEAISQDKTVYYNKLTDSRENSYDEWIKFFLSKCRIQAEKLSNYIDSLNGLYEKTKATVSSVLNSTKLDEIINCLFTQPIINASYLANNLSVTQGQAKRYLDKLEDAKVLQGDDKKRCRQYRFQELLELARR